MKTIAFDGICLADGPITGVGRSFLNALSAYADRKDANCVLLVPKGVSIAPIDGVLFAESPCGALRRQRQLPALLRSLNASVLHSSVASIPLGATCPTIATAHDLPWLHAELNEHSSVWRRFATLRALRGATRILVPSSMTQHDVLRLLGKKRPPIELVMHGALLGEAPTEQSTGLRSGPMLVLGDDRRRKNRTRLQAAHHIALERNPDLPQLEFIGPPNSYIRESAKNLLLQSCRAVVHVSLFEGFGMPILEALAHGAPIVCSDLPPHREIADENALYVDPRSTESIAKGLARIHEDDELRWQQAKGGHVRALQLQPSHTAAHWARIHQEVLA